uniref:Uncharacterized protein n=1 Tax=Opuntia streptacantha TaxID=393608 RepID=A0A7C8YZH5_OPUST
MLPVLAGIKDPETCNISSSKLLTKKRIMLPTLITCRLCDVLRYISCPFLILNLNSSRISSSVITEAENPRTTTWMDSRAIFTTLPSKNVSGFGAKSKRLAFNLTAR